MGTPSTPSTPEDGIRRTIALYAQMLDDGRFAEWADLFTEDTRFLVADQTHQGRQAAAAFIEAVQPPEARGRHACMPPVIDLAEDRRTARAVTDYLFFRADGAVSSMGRYHDELALGDDDRWRFTTREIVFQGDQPVGRQPEPG
jgi:3-phenylpropionate/cinnamic acid dioxygenase small subunit